ncbi:hypothetical protein CBS101457_003926 [Exobasidium rhododendri]|nr:hypothetical protein CBS101457_003926 [Exobasidium rhododendri]
MSLPPIVTLMNDTERSTLFKQGAEAKVYISNIFPAPLLTHLSNESKPSSSKATVGLLKYRFPKTYRHQTLSSQLTSSRTTAEARALVRCAKAGVNTPSILCVDEVHGVLGLELIEGHSVRELLGGGSEGNEVDSGAETDLKAKEKDVDIIDDVEATIAMKLIGVQLAKMHQIHVIHGDLTTSNMMVSREANGELKVYIIDFGLSSNSTMTEDKAVDLYVLEKAFQSTHPSSDHLYSQILRAYQETLEATPSSAHVVKSKRSRKGEIDKSHIKGPTIWSDIEKRLEEVRMRGRKRSMVG